MYSSSANKAFLVSFLLILLLTGCTTKYREANRKKVGVESPLPINARWEYMKTAEGEAHGYEFLGLFTVLADGDRIGKLKTTDVNSGSIMNPLSMSYFFSPLENPIQKAAKYDALYSVEEADAMLVPKYRWSKTNYLLFTSKTAYASGKAIKLVETKKKPAE